MYEIFKSLFPIFYGLNNSKNVITEVVKHNNVIDKSMRDIDITEMISTKSVAKFAEMKICIFLPYTILNIIAK